MVIRFSLHSLLNWFQNPFLNLWGRPAAWEVLNCFLNHAHTHHARAHTHTNHTDRMGKRDSRSLKTAGGPCFCPLLEAEVRVRTRHKFKLVSRETCWLAACQKKPYNTGTTQECTHTLTDETYYHPQNRDPSARLRSFVLLFHPPLSNCLIRVSTNLSSSS